MLSCRYNCPAAAWSDIGGSACGTVLISRFDGPETVAYRADIDGLRAVAVVAVLLFHAGIPGFAGGFVGVDVFFVISGFLITSIIARQLERGQFTFAGFLRPAHEAHLSRLVHDRPRHRHRRRLLLPSVGLPLARSIDRRDGGLCIQYPVLGPGRLFRRTGELKPLLHTWSLSIEEQFYLAFPCLLVLLWRMSPRDRRRIVAGLAAASFLVGVVATRKEPQAAFYLLPSRAWELLTGSLLALIARPDALAAVARGAGWLGLSLIILAVAALDARTPFPGFAALLPTMGAALVIGAGGKDRLGASKLLGSLPFTTVGRLSFSLYLWHWPVLSTHALRLGTRARSVGDLAAIAASIVLAILSWRLVEEPFRHPRSATRGGGPAQGSCVHGLHFPDGGRPLHEGGLPQRLPDRLLAYGEVEPSAAQSRLHCAVWSGARTELTGVCLVGDLSAPSWGSR